MEEDKEIDRLRTLSGIALMGDGFADRDTGCVMSEDISAEDAKAVLRRVASVVNPGDWEAILSKHPEWRGHIEPKLKQASRDR